MIAQPVSEGNVVAKEAGLQSVIRAFAVLDAVAAAGGQAGISSIAAATGLAESTVHRMASTLVDLGSLRRLPDRRYALAARLVRLGAAAASVVAGEAGPVLTRLVAALGESANLATLSGDQAEYVAQAPSPHTMRTFTEVGRRVDLHCTGVGKAILSALPDERVDAILDRTGMARRTEFSLVDRAALRTELDEARERGWCFDEEEQELGVRCIAMPIPVDGPVYYAVSVSGPLPRMTDALIERAAPLLADAAREIAGLLTAPGR
jgi:IclR family acetate operon transcriptional repressor